MDKRILTLEAIDLACSLHVPVVYDVYRRRCRPQPHVYPEAQGCLLRMPSVGELFRLEVAGLSRSLEVARNIQTIEMGG